MALDSYGGEDRHDPHRAGALLGTDLSNDHPVSFLYDTALAAADGD